MSPLDIYSNDTVVCGFTTSVGYEMEAMHIHEVYEIYMALCDGVRYFVNDRMCLLERGDVMLFTNNDLHKVSVSPQMEYKRCVITFPPDKFRSLFGEGQRLLSCFEEGENAFPLKLTQEEQVRFLSLAHEIAQEKSSGDYSEIARWLGLGQLLLHLCKIRERLPAYPVIERNTFLHTQKVLKYIDEHFTEDLSLDDLSSLCFLNKSYLCRLFKRETGFHIHDYIVYRRLANAMALLRSGQSVHEAARMSGFRSDTFFITVFRRHLNMTPYQYAKKHRANLNA